ncbi:MAG: hypothetical protein AAGG48_00935 [Planctomycetota bacterium]
MMNSRILYRFCPSWTRSLAAMVVIAACQLPHNCAFGQAASKETTTWKKLGFDHLSEEFSDDQISLFEGLNASRGTWLFEGETVVGGVSSAFAGRLQVSGNPKSGRLPMWKMNWVWTADESEYVMFDSIMASPQGNEFELMLFRVGPVKKPIAGRPRDSAQTKMFKGTWDTKNKVINWSKASLPVRDAQVEVDIADPKSSLTMIVTEDGRVSFKSEIETETGPLLFTGNARERIGQAPVETTTLTGKHEFKSATEVTDRRIKPCLPSQATDISLQSERGGHFARYTIAEDDLMEFLDQLWEAEKDNSAHERQQMSGEGEPVKKERMAKRFASVGWEPLNNATIYYSPSKPSGAMTTYYYDRELGMAYHDTGYW